MIIVFVNLIGPILYFLVGRVDGVPADRRRRPAPCPAGAARTIRRSPPPPARRRSGAAPVAPRPTPLRPSAPAARARRALPAPRPRSRSSGLTRRYPGGVVALDGLTLDVPPGSVFGLLGPNGAGKTTTLRLLAGLTRATAGRATVAGLDVAGGPARRRRHLGYLEQDPGHTAG